MNKSINRNRKTPASIRGGLGLFLLFLCAWAISPALSEDFFCTADARGVSAARRTTVGRPGVGVGRPGAPVVAARRTTVIAPTVVVAPTYYPPSSCQDYDANCPYWASIGECQRNPGYMLSSCCASCS